MLAAWVVAAASWTLVAAADPWCPDGCARPSSDALNCSGAGLERVSNVTFSDTEEVDLSWNRLLAVDVSGSVRRLSLAGNVDLDLYRVSSDSVAFLDLAHCNISRVPGGAFAGVPRLEVLDLSYNEIDVLEEDAFLDLSHLTRINLHSNRLRCADHRPFSAVGSLRHLDLSHNMLASPEDVLEMLATPQLANYSCVSQISAFYLWYRSSDVNLTIEEQATLTDAGSKTWGLLEKAANISGPTVASASRPTAAQRMDPPWYEKDLPTRASPVVRMDAMDIIAIILVYASIVAGALYACKLLLDRWRVKYSILYPEDEEQSTRRVVAAMVCHEQEH